jgi:Flp pilus assembly protein TadG
VELAFVIPLVLLFLFGIIDFGLALNQQNQDTNIANIAAREASLGTATSAQCGGTTYTTLKAWAICEASATGTPIANFCVGDIATTAGPTSTTYTSGDPLEVEVTSNFSWMKLITGHVGNLSSTIGGNATMRIETTPSTGSSSATAFLNSPCSS